MTDAASGAPDQWADRANATLAAAGYRRGGARHRVIGLVGAQRCALSAAELHEALAREQRAVSRASIYRILEELERAELVARIEVGQGIVRFEAIRHGAGHHHHLVCDHCGLLIPFSDEGLERELERVSEQVPLVVAEHDVILRGECAACSEHA